MATARNAAALVRPLVTPEGVDLRVKLADAGTRASGFLLDVVIIIVAAVVVSLVAIFGLGGLGARDVEPLFIVWIIFIFLLRNVYFIAFEAGPAGGDARQADGRCAGCIAQRRGSHPGPGHRA
ncbi:hypothetical protein MPLB_570016 [Mesorhizobium sp. ORS 3324]|nr:hypothetical protein MPLB_570016 [Mesorhizobium sp. ORS 3324]